MLSFGHVTLTWRKWQWHVNTSASLLLETPINHVHSAPQEEKVREEGKKKEYVPQIIKTTTAAVAQKKDIQEPHVHETSVNETRQLHQRQLLLMYMYMTFTWGHLKNYCMTTVESWKISFFDVSVFLIKLIGSNFCLVRRHFFGVGTAQPCTKAVSALSGGHALSGY